MTEYLENSNRGRPKGSSNKKMRWKVIFYNKETNKIEEREYTAVKEMKELGINNGGFKGFFFPLQKIYYFFFRLNNIFKKN